MIGKATAIANPNIAFVKYWGKADDALNLPANPSLSMNLAALTTVTTVEFGYEQARDTVAIDGCPATGQAWKRVATALERVRAIAGIDARARVESRNDFPVGTGLASSASAFAALSLASARAAGLAMDEAALSRLARLGSGSACRSVPSGFCLWEGDTDTTSHARQVVPPHHWDLYDVIAIVTRKHKTVSSNEGHSLACTSPLHAARLEVVPRLLETVISGIRERNLWAMGPAIECDALAMHGVMMTSSTSLLYWEPATVAVLQAVRAWRKEGLAAFFSLDAGPNVHCFCEAGDAEALEARLRNLAGVQDVLVSGAGPGVRATDRHLF